VNPRFLSTAGLARLSLRMQRDDRLAELAGLGSEPAFEAIVHRYRPALVRHCAQVVGYDDADEAVQDALLKAHRALARGTPVHSLGPWLHAVAHNSALSLLRGRRRTTEYREEQEGPRRAVDELGDAHGERLEALLSALRSLPSRQRRALVMREFEGRSYEEIAVRLGATNGAVRQLLNRARASVRERLIALIPVEIVLRWASATGGAVPSGALTLAGGGAFAAKLSSAILLSAMPVVAVNPLPAKATSPTPSHKARPSIVRTVSRPAHATVLHPAIRVLMAATPRSAAATAPRRMATTRDPAAPQRVQSPAGQQCPTAARAKPAGRLGTGRSRSPAPDPQAKATPPVGIRTGGTPAMMASGHDAVAGQAPTTGSPGAAPGLNATTAGA
jgi:RNA polymerase sigma factor (sigma-70 family)